jgi:class 3 adenylate cyclase
MALSQRLIGHARGRPRKRSTSSNGTRSGTSAPQYRCPVDQGRARYTASDDGVTLAYATRGEGSPDLLMGPIGTISFESVEDEPGLARFERRLASFGRLIRYDGRGMGLSDRGSPSLPGTVEEKVGDAIAVLDAVGSERAAVVGAFQGSPYAIALAAAHPERISHLVLIEGYARAFADEDFPYGVAMDWTRHHGFLGDQFDPDALEQGIDVVGLLAPSRADDQAFRSWWVRAGNLGANPAMAEALFNASLAADVRHVLPEIRVPTLVIERPEITTWAPQGRYLVEQIAGAELLQLPGTDALHWVGESAAMLDAIEEFVTGTRGGAGAERVLATVLFTDIVGSTDHAARLGDDQWHDLLDRHDQIVRIQIQRFRGREVNTTGDGFVATFESPGRAIECALAIGEHLGRSGIASRAGVHTGEVEVRGDDIAGVAVHIGARVAALAGSGEVMVSSTVRDLVAGSRFAFRSCGDHELKGIPGTWTLYLVDS